MPHVHLMLAAALAAFAAGGGQQAPPPVGQDVCVTCHEDLTRQFAASAHGQIATFEYRGQRTACESCHGPAAQHAESGDASLIRGFAALPASAANKACLVCHRADQGMHWPGSEHDAGDVACVQCHTIHQSRQVVPGLMKVGTFAVSHAAAPAPRASLAKAEPDLCYSCHPDKRAKFMSSSRHPVREGRMTCSSCHQVHGAPGGMVRTDERVNELCLKCHTKYQGPFIFEHSPVSESCLTCHDPHAAVANHLLKQNEPFLCLQCHEMHFHNARVSISTPYFPPSAGSTNPFGPTGFMKGYGTKCTVCHPKTHGSDLPSQGVSGRKALTR